MKTTRDQALEVNDPEREHVISLLDDTLRPMFDAADHVYIRVLHDNLTIAIRFYTASGGMVTHKVHDPHREREVTPDLGTAVERLLHPRSNLDVEQRTRLFQLLRLIEGLAIAEAALERVADARNKNIISEDVRKRCIEERDRIGVVLRGAFADVESFVAAPTR